ncbi:MAG: helix-turn-helix domain containing protein, partial [Candidatus Azambacteria bacterium]|nr:helix-turn-helix domain containing protein [Candidatus Azambacteria bacterium]
MNPLKQNAIKLRKAGYSYSMISKELNVAKSTLSNWLTNIPFKPNKEVLKRVGKAKLKSALYKQKIKFENITRMKNEAAREVGEVSLRDLFMLGIGLYLGEGSKSHEEVRIASADPTIIKLGIKWLTEFG